MSFVINTTRAEIAIVETAVANKPAITLYEKSGFVEVNRWMTTFGILKIKLQRNFTGKKTF